MFFARLSLSRWWFYWEIEQKRCKLIKIALQRY